MKAIRTRFHGATNFTGSRISASDEGGNRVTIPYPHEFGPGEGAHRKAAEALCAKMHWTGEMIGGSLHDGYAFVWLPPSYHRQAMPCETCGGLPCLEGCAP